MQRELSSGPALLQFRGFVKEPAMLGDGIKAKQLEEKVQTLDVMEIVDKVTRSRDAES